MKVYINKLKQDLEEEAVVFDREKEILTSEIKNRDMALADLEKALENARRNNNDLK